MHVERAATYDEDMTSEGVKTQGAMKRRSAGIYGLIISFEHKGKEDLLSCNSKAPDQGQETNVQPPLKETARASRTHR
jgi:hypothetical protein